jgi:quercetin 2,3-dioxygenase
LHEDTAGEKQVISNNHIMLMNAGAGIYHQESIPENGEAAKVLQIFLRPSTDNETPQVQFYDFSAQQNIDDWRLIAGYDTTKAPLLLRTMVNVYDRTVLKDQQVLLPNKQGKTYLLHVMKGNVQVENNDYEKGSSIIYSNENLLLEPAIDSNLVLFELDNKASYSTNGMYSGLHKK